jgi:hypothetical protein
MYLVLSLKGCLIIIIKSTIRQMLKNVTKITPNGSIIIKQYYNRRTA